MSPTESDLRSYLRHEAEDVDARGDLSAAIFAAKRRSDRRRVVGVVAAAVLAMALPVAWSVGGRTPVTPATTPALSPSTSQTSSPSTAAPTTSPTATAPTDSPTAIPTVTALAEDAAVTAKPTLSDASPDGDPGVPYSVRGVLRDGTAAIDGPLQGGFPTFARLDHGGYILRATSGSDQKAYIVSADGKATVLEGAEGFVVSADRSRIAWTDGQAINTPGAGLVHIADSSGRERSTVRVDGMPTALIGDTLFVIKVAGFDFLGTSLRIDLTSDERTEIQGNVYAVHAATGLAIAAEPVPPEPSSEQPADRCYRIVDVRAEQPSTRLRACGDHLPTAFSPDGRYVFGRGGENTLVVADSTTGEVVLDALGTSGLHPEAARMTDDGTAIVLSVLSADLTRNGLVRCELTGECTQVGGTSVKTPAPEDTDTPRTAYGVAVN